MIGAGQVIAHRHRRVVPDEHRRGTRHFPHRVAGVRLELGQNFSEYPRVLLIEGADGGGAAVRLFNGNAVPGVARGLVQYPQRAPIDIAFPPTPTSTLRLVQIGASQWAWSIQELTIWERP